MKKFLLLEDSSRFGQLWMGINNLFSYDVGSQYLYFTRDVDYLAPLLADYHSRRYSSSIPKVSLVYESVTIDGVWYPKLAVAAFSEVAIITFGQSTMTLDNRPPLVQMEYKFAYKKMQTLLGGNRDLIF